MNETPLKLIANGLAIALLAAGSRRLSSHIQGFDTISRQMVGEAEAQAGHAVPT